MPTRASLAPRVSFSLAVVLATFAVACGGNEDASLFPSVAPDAGPPIQTDAGATFSTGPGDAGDGPCSPAPLASSFAPTWKAPLASASGACTESQIQGFYDACLASGVTPTTCSTYVAANGTCASCLQTDDTASKYGAVIWHSNRSYFTINVAGCIADEQNDPSSSGCAAAYQAVLECKETACTQCYDPATGDFARYAACENETGAECSKFQSAESAACGGDLRDAASPASVCEPGSNATAEDAYLLVAPVLCGN